MENAGSEADGQPSTEQPAIAFSPTTESRIDLWQQTGSFPYPQLQVFPPPQTHEYSKNDLRLMHHLSTISNDLRMNGTTALTLWTQKMPKFLSLASSYPFVMHALLSFSANHLAWSRSSDETRHLHIHHGTIALRGLHDAIGNFSHANADAVLAASLLLLWQATDWRSWSSLRAGIQSVLGAMQAWKHESIFAEYISQEDLLVGSQSPVRTMPDPAERYRVLSDTVQALHRLQSTLVGHEAESYWIGQLCEYVQRLQTSNPPQTVDDQFSHVYLLRKWLFWVPVLLLQRQGGQGPAMLTLAHFYATALTLEPLYPDLGSAFCARIALSPLENIISVTDAMQSQHAMDQNSMEIASLMQFPRRTALQFRSSMMDAAQGGRTFDSPVLLSPDTLSYTSIGNLSPAFTPAPLHAVPGPILTSSYLEVPVSQPGFTYGTQQWGTVPSPGFPPPEYTLPEDQIYGSGMDFRGGFVTPTPIWT